MPECTPDTKESKTQNKTNQPTNGGLAFEKLLCGEQMSHI